MRFFSPDKKFNRNSIISEQFFFKFTFNINIIKNNKKINNTF